VLEERRRIARDLHDGLAQELAFIANRTRELSLGPVTRTALQQVASAAQRGLDESRRAIQTLTTISDEPFDVALVQAVEEVADRLGANVEIEAEPAPEMTSEQREQLLRIVREAVTNASRHANADLVRVQFTNGGPLHLRVEDDGAGFDVDDTDGHGFGLVTMEERALAIGADFSVSSTPGRGTAVEVRL
jgi:signal transduction histidine kinase